MQKLVTSLSLFIALIILSACSTNPDLTNPDSTETTKKAKECEKITPSLTKKLVSSSKSDNIDGWQLMLDYPSCFPGADFDLAKAQLEALKNQK